MPYFTTPYVICDSSVDRWAITWQDNIHYNWTPLLPRPIKRLEKQDTLNIRLGPECHCHALGQTHTHFHGEKNAPVGTQL